MNENNQEYNVKYRLEKAKATLIEVDTHIKNKFWNTSVNRMYYACFYAVSALLLKNKIDATTHAGIRLKFGEHFVKTGKIERNVAKLYTDLFVKRNKGDYNDFFDYDEDTVTRLYPQTVDFIRIIEQLINN